MGDLCNERAPAQRAVVGVVPVSRAVMGEITDARARAAIGVAPARGAMIGDLTDATVTERASIGVAPARGATIGELTDASLTERAAFGVAPAPHAMMGDLSDARVTELSVPVANRTSPESLRSAALGEPGGTLRRQAAHPPPTSADEGADKMEIERDVIMQPFQQEEQHDPYKDLNENEMSQELLNMIIRSVQKNERRKSARKPKRKRIIKTTIVNNGSDADDEQKAYSRCSISFLFQFLERVRSCPHYVHLVKWMGFGHVLELDDCWIPRSFVKWIADHVSTDQEEIVIGSKSIKLSPQSVVDTLGTPAGELPVDSDEINGKAAFLAIFGLSKVPTIRYFGKKILAKEILPDDIFCRCFMSVCLGTFYCPNSNTKVSTKYMGALVVVEKIKDRNWAKFIHEWMILYIKKFLKEPVHEKQLILTLGGCIYSLATNSTTFMMGKDIQETGKVLFLLQGR